MVEFGNPTISPPDQRHDGMKPALTLIAGHRARHHLETHGLRADDVKVLIAASGGPKWFILKALDQYLFGEFFKNRQTPLRTLGSSVGAWQMACFAQPDPVAAIERLAEHYSRETYSERPDRHEITDKAQRLLQQVLGHEGGHHLVTHPVLQTHVLACRSRGPLASEQRALLMGGLAAAATLNATSRRTLGWFFERVVLHSGEQSGFRFDDLPTRYVPLCAETVEPALMASGAIPLVLSGVRGLPGAPPGVYRDGGIIDYHFDLPLLPPPSEGLVLYPHFSRSVTPGWFDKALHYRRVNPANYSSTVILAPSPELVASLPFGKISDRKDFQTLDATTRLKTWRAVIDAGRHLADAVAELVATGRGLDRITPFPGD